MHNGSTCYHNQIVEKSFCKFSITLPPELSLKIKHMKGKKTKTVIKKCLQDRRKKKKERKTILIIVVDFFKEVCLFLLGK